MAHKAEEPVTRKSNYVVATIPWITSSPSSSLGGGVKLEDSEFFKDMKASKDQINLRLYRLLNKIFPHYLPKRYHTMDGWSLHENSTKGQYWAHAANFLMLNQQSQQNMFYIYLLKELESKCPDFSQFEPTSNLMGSVEKLEQCETAAEFLLEPWVLIQLPFQPILYQQWVQALMAETMWFQKEVADFFCLPLPSHVRSLVEPLKHICEQLFGLTLKLVLIHFSSTQRLKLHYNISKCAVSIKMILDIFLCDLMPILEFVLSEECRNIVKFLKAKTWNKNNPLSSPDYRDGFIHYKGREEFGRIPFIYSLDYWKSRKPVQFLLDCEELSLEKVYAADLMPNGKVFWSKDEKNELIKIVEENIIKPGRICGLPNHNLILDAITWQDKEIRFDYLLYKRLLATSSQTNVAKDENYGVIYNLISLFSDLKIEEALADLTSRLAYKLLENPSRGIYLEPVRCDSTNLSTKLKYIEKKLTSLTPNPKWKHQNILNQIRATCFSPHRTLKPELHMGARKIADHFHERIKNLVFKMLDTHCKIFVDSTLHLYQELQTVQYMLPCFVASFLDLDKDADVSQEMKKKYLDFVHELVRSYEENEFMQKLNKGWLKNSFTEIHQQRIVFWKLSHWAQNINNCFPKEINSKKVADPFCHSVNCMIKDISTYPASVFRSAGEPDLLKPWTLTTYMFLCRINNCMEKKAWIDDNYFKGVDFMTCLFSYYKIDIGTKSSMEKFNASDFTPSLDYSDFSKTNFLLDESSKSGQIKLDCVQLLGIWLYKNIRNNSKVGDVKGKLAKHNILSPCFSPDPTDLMLWNFVKSDLWKLMLQIKSFLKCKNFEGMSMTVSLDLAKDIQSYIRLLKQLTPDKKVKMSRPGEITFFPVDHCRWCGLVEVKEFRTCPECLEDPEYADVNLFCSEKCQKEALEKKHTEEHASFLLEKCGIFK